MAENAPEIACSLTQPEFRRRKADIRQTLMPHLVRSVQDDGATHLVFARPAVSRAKLEDLIALEAACCPFLRFELRETEKEIVLTVSGPAGSEELVRDLFACEPTVSCGASDGS
ncbi:MAG: hypothetical protein AAGG56_12990 [Pseudomonadota bacterium]